MKIVAPIKKFYFSKQSPTGHPNQITKATGRQITTYNKPISSNHPKKMLKFVPSGSLENPIS